MTPSTTCKVVVLLCGLVVAMESCSAMVSSVRFRASPSMVANIPRNVSRPVLHTEVHSLYSTIVDTGKYSTAVRHSGDMLYAPSTRVTVKHKTVRADALQCCQQ